jgi:hypothetical protein
MTPKKLVPDRSEFSLVSFVRKSENALPIAKARIAMLEGRKLNAGDRQLYLQALKYVASVEKQGSTKPSDVQKVDCGDSKGPKVLSCAASRLALIVLIWFSPPVLT